MKYKEFGGYLPFELDIKNEYFTSEVLENVRRLNSGRSAILFSLYQLSAKRIFLPLFYCPTVIDSIRNAGFEIVFYKIDDKLNPIFENRLSKNDTIILVDYYGVKRESIKKMIGDFECNIILDFAHDFFAEPVIQSNVFNVYSCRKFLGVPDGAYVIASYYPKNVVLEDEQSFNRTAHLMKSLELPTSSAYELNLENERYVGTTYKGMSLLTKKILCSANYEKIKKIRMENFNRLHLLLSKYQRLELADNTYPAYCYPLLLDVDLRKRLIENKIWVPTMWRELIVDSLQGTLEYIYSKNMHCLPIDQRYNTEDMEYLAKIVIELYEKYR